MRALLATAAAWITCTAALADTAAGSHRYVAVNGARLYTETFGNGPPIVFLHGGLRYFDTSFAMQRGDFARTHAVIGIDQRGLGHSPDTAQPLSYQEMADDTAAVIRELVVGPVDVVGHSDGADVGLLLARDHPELVRRLVISGANLRAGTPPAELRRRAGWSPAQVDEAVRKIAAKLPPRFRAEYAAVSPDGDAHWIALLTKHYTLWLTPVVIESADLRRIAAPVLVMGGDHDFTSLEEIAETYRGLPHGQLLILPDTGHDTFGARPALVNQAIREFLERPPTEDVVR